MTQRIFSFALVVLATSQAVAASERCLPANDVQMPVAQDLEIKGTPYSLGICYLPEKVRGGRIEPEHRDLVFLSKNQKRIASIKTRISITVGRISDLKLEKANKLYIAVSYVAGEFCNGIGIFNTLTKKAAWHGACESPTEECHVIELPEAGCQATLECVNGPGESAKVVTSVPRRKDIQLCQRSK